MLIVFLFQGILPDGQETNSSEETFKDINTRDLRGSRMRLRTFIIRHLHSNGCVDFYNQASSLLSLEEGSLEEHCHSNGLLGIEEVGSQILIWLGVRLV